MTSITGAPASSLGSALLADIRAHAGALDCGDDSSRRSFPALGAAGLLGLGAPGNTGGRLPEMASVIAEISGVCMSTAFSVWANRMVVEYLLTAGTLFGIAAVRPLLAGTALGVTGMAAAFKDAAGCGTLELTASPIEGGYELSGRIRWASNLHPDSLLVTAARTQTGEKLMVALPLNTPGVSVGDHLDLLALGSTASSSLVLDGVRITAEQVLSENFGAFLTAVRPTFLLLQSAMCLGLARASVAQSQLELTGVNSVFTADVDGVAGEITVAERTLTAMAAAIGNANEPTSTELLWLRLTAAELASASTALELRTAGGKGYASRTAASRRYREAAFIPVQSPSEAQLRWELGRSA
jgi:alkylation response protein AidB-like acyl-CoA dehydrogenase